MVPAVVLLVERHFIREEPELAGRAWNKNHRHYTAAIGTATQNVNKSPCTALCSPCFPDGDVTVRDGPIRDALPFSIPRVFFRNYNKANIFCRCTCADFSASSFPNRYTDCKIPKKQTRRFKMPGRCHLFKLLSENKNTQSSLTQLLC